MSKLDVSFIVEGVPEGQDRPRARVMKTADGRLTAMMYNTEKSRRYRALIEAAASQVKPSEPVRGKPMRITVHAYYPIPKSMPKYLRPFALAGEIRPIVKPDIKNIISIIEDGLNGILWGDDCQVVSYDGTGKWYSEWPRVEVRVCEL